MDKRFFVTEVVSLPDWFFCNLGRFWRNCSVISFPVRIDSFVRRQIRRSILSLSIRVIARTEPRLYGALGAYCSPV